MAVHTKASLSAKTEKNYGDVYERLGKRAREDNKGKLTPKLLVDWLIKKRHKWSPSSWRQNRSAVRFGFEVTARMRPQQREEIDAAMKCLDETPPAPKDPAAKEILKTSQQKSKRVKRKDHEIIRNLALSSSSPNAHVLVNFMEATRVAGLREVEWRYAEFRHCHVDPYQFELVVRNAKYDEVRAHGEVRTLRWLSLDSEIIEAITQTIAHAKGFEDDEAYEKWRKTLQAFLRRLTKLKFKLRKKRPSLYSFRHEAIAGWKAHYVSGHTSLEEKRNGLAIVAALAGHATDETASEHYGRPKRGESSAGRLVPSPDAEEVARIRQTMKLGLQRFRQSNPAP